MMKLLLHQCCGPCSVYPLQILLADGGIDVHGYFYNPNIHPYTEFKKRLDTLIAFNELKNIPYTAVDSYSLRPFLQMEHTEQNRCTGCYRMRLMNVAEFARTNSFSAFTSTLLYSKWQNHDNIKSIAREAATEYGVDFYYEDYRRGWQVGINLSKELGMYRQQYCGCIFSEEERYCTPKKSKV